MPTLVLDPDIEEQVKADRAATGADRWDEVWDGVYVMPPLPNDEHQQIVTRLAAVLQDVVGWPGDGEVRAGVNVSDRIEGWEHNYRAPDVAVFLRGTSARNCGTHWQGGPDFLAEVLSTGDQGREKLRFYALVGVREALLLDRNPWALELYQLKRKRMSCVGRVSPGDAELLTSSVLPLAFQLTSSRARPLVEVHQRNTGQRWQI